MGLDRESSAPVRAEPGEGSGRRPTFSAAPRRSRSIRLGATLFSVGMRLALPVVALLVMVDVALALLGRINAQLQLLTLAFPAKDAASR